MSDDNEWRAWTVGEDDRELFTLGDKVILLAIEAGMSPEVWQMVMLSSLYDTTGES